MNLTQWFASTGLTTVCLAILGYIARNWFVERLKNSIKHEYDKDLELHKANLKRDYDIQIETMKAEFAKNQFRFSHIFERTADAIIKMYQMLVDLQDEVHVALGVSGRWDDEALKKKNELYIKRADAYRFLVRHKIYLEKSTAQKIEEFSKKLVEVQLIYDMELRTRSPESHDKISAAMNSLYNVVPKLLEDLENDFKKTLGVA